MQDYSTNQIRKMEQEATRRARETASKARQNKETEHQKNTPPCQNKKPQKNKGSLGFLNALDIKKLIGENNEQALILLLILLLNSDENCDEFLLYALIYIML